MYSQSQQDIDVLQLYKNNYGNDVKLLFTDIDPLSYEIKTEDSYADIENDMKSMFDTSDYP